MLESETRRIAVIGAGPAAFYAIDHLLEQREIRVEIDVFERLPTPWGLVRNGVAADHPEKKGIIDRHFAHLLRHARVRFFGATEVGRHISVAELSSWYDAVLYAVGADEDTRLGIAGEDLPGVLSARAFVAWCNGHPDFSGLAVDLSIERAVIVGNGNVALDVARILAAPVARLERTDIADHALVALRGSRIRNIVVLGRRGPEHAAFNNPEIEEFGHLGDVGLNVDRAVIARAPTDDADIRRKLATLDRLASLPRLETARHVDFRFFATSEIIAGEDRVARVMVRDGAGDIAPIETGLVIQACGYRRTGFPGLPFDAARGVIANIAGRIGTAETLLPRNYVTGWAKRGCRGIIGTNKKCAQQTVEAMLADLGAQSASRAIDAHTVAAIVAERNPRLVTRVGWNRIDRHERDAGRRHDRPRVKLVAWDEMLARAAMTL